MDTELRKGMFLIAAPSLRDPNFRQTVVLLCEHGSEGALGVIVNRPTAMSISEALCVDDDDGCKSTPFDIACAAITCPSDVLPTVA